MALRMSPRIHIQKTGPPSFFPTHLPRDAKIKPNNLPTIHEEGSWGNSKAWLQTISLLAVLRPSSRVSGRLSPSWSGDKKAFFASRAPCRSDQVPASKPFLRVGQFWFHNCKPCFPGSGWRRSLSSARNQGPGNCFPLVQVGLTPI